MFSLPDMPSLSISSVLLTVLAMLVGTLLNQVLAITKKLIPEDLLSSKLENILGKYYPQMTVVIDEKINGLSVNELFEASEIYLRGKISPSVGRLNASKASGENDLCVTVSQGERIVDTFRGIQVTWQLIRAETKKRSDDHEIVEYRSFELSFYKRDKEKVQRSYLPYVLKTSEESKAENKVVKLHSYGGSWSSVNLDHPSTFETLAMDPTLKQEIKGDLNRFVRRREFYRRVGKPWKRGYLLYGPPGTGKSSLIAAMANHLKFHIYEVDLTSLHNNSELQRLLVSTANQSILVFEDIDCYIKFQNRQLQGYSNDDKQLTLSGLLSFSDGLWSSCGDEKIIIFTTNQIEKLDPALLRPGRMDMHIHMSYCTPSGFKILASNYLGINNHYSFTEIEELLTEVEVTPSEIAEELMKSDEADIALGGLVMFLRRKREHYNANAEREI